MASLRRSCLAFEFLGPKLPALRPRARHYLLETWSTDKAGDETGDDRNFSMFHGPEVNTDQGMPTSQDGGGSGGGSGPRALAG